MKPSGLVGPKGRAIFVMLAVAIGGAAAMGFASGPPPGGHSPRPTGRMIVFTAPTDWLGYPHGWTYVRRLAGGKWHMLPRFAEPYGGNASQRPRAYAWSPNGRYLLDNLDISPFESEYLPIQLLDPGGRVVQDLTPGDQAMVALSPTWAPDSKQILLGGRALLEGSYWGGFFDESLTGELTQLTTDPKFIPSDDTARFAGDSRDPAADIWLRAWKADNRRTFWLPSSHRLLVGSYALNGPPYFWENIDTNTGKSYSLPFPAFSQVAMSRDGTLAGIIPSCLAAVAHGKPGCPPSGFKSAWGTERVATGPIYVESPARHGSLLRVGWGYDPVWSSDGRWLYFASRSSFAALKYRMQFNLSNPYWATVTSAIYHSHIYRVRANGTDRQTITSADNYGFADINVLANGAVVFTSIPSDWNLWLHRKQGLTVLGAGPYLALPSIEETLPNQRPIVLIHDAYSPAVQP